MKTYRELKIWSIGVNIAVACYELTCRFPREELYGMTSQIRRASTSIAANVAEGYGRGRGEYIQFVRYALGSLNELETHLEVCIRVGLLTEDALTKLRPYLEEEGRMLTGIIQKAAEKKEQAS